MNVNSCPPNPEASVLQHRFSLGELLDLESFRDVCESYAGLFQIGFKIFDLEKEKLVDVKGTSTEFCGTVFAIPQGKVACTREVMAIRDVEPGEREIVVHNCFSGLRYLIAPITHECTTIGKVVFGPYLPTENTQANFAALGERFDRELGLRLLGRVRRTGDEVVRKVVSHLVQTIEVILHVGYRHALTTKMHLEAVSQSFTELQEKNRALQESFARLKELDRLKSNFLATVSHELRTPLTSVIGYSEMLLEGLAGPLTEEQRGYLATIMEKGEQLLGLITGILDFSKIESGNLRLNPKATNLVEVARTSISTALPLARKRGISIDFAAEDGVPILNLDEDKLRQVLVNLLGNAVKFNREKGKISVRIARVSRAHQATGADRDLPAAFAPVSDEFVGIAVSDTGVGIAKEQQEKIFDSFYQVDGSSTREYGGTGLGLAITKNLVEAQGGRIEVESELSRGSTFTVLLPLPVQG